MIRWKVERTLSKCFRAKLKWTRSLVHTHRESERQAREHIETKMCLAFLPELVILFIFNLFFSCIFHSWSPFAQFTRAHKVTRIRCQPILCCLSPFPCCGRAPFSASLKLTKPIFASFFVSLTLFNRMHCKSLAENFLDSMCRTKSSDNLNSPIRGEHKHIWFWIKRPRKTKCTWPLCWCFGVHADL